MSTLNSFKPGQTVIVGAPSVYGDVHQRLAELGLVAGAEVTITRRGPFGDPLEVEVKQTRICLRASKACEYPATLVEANADD